jgi:hypothetical protein
MTGLANSTNKGVYTNLDGADVMTAQYKHLLSILLVSMMLWGNAMAGDDKPAGTLVIDETQVMLLVGGDIGGGTLLLGDKSYSFKTGGVKLGGVGVHKVHLVGDVYHLKNVADFPGVYVTAEAGITVIKGVGGMWLRNDHGVVIHLKASADGLALSLGAEGLKISMD